MDIKEWDQQIIEVARQLAMQSRGWDQKLWSQKHALVKLKQSIFQMQSVLASVLNRLYQVRNGSILLHSMQRSVLYWGGVYAEKVHNLLVGQVEYMGKLLWFRLIRMRLNMDSPVMPDNLSEMHVMEASIRRNRLLEKEKQLGRYASELDLERRRLFAQYESQEIAESNVDANFASLPVGREVFKEFLTNVYTNTRYHTPKFLEIKRTCAAIDEELSRIWEASRGLVVEDFDGGSPQTFAHKKQMIEDSLGRVEFLERELVQAKMILTENPTNTPVVIARDLGYNHSSF